MVLNLCDFKFLKISLIRVLRSLRFLRDLKLETKYFCAICDICVTL